MRKSTFRKLLNNRPLLIGMITAIVLILSSGAFATYRAVQNANTSTQPAAPASAVPAPKKTTHTSGADQPPTSSATPESQSETSNQAQSNTSPQPKPTGNSSQSAYTACVAKQSQAYTAYTSKHAAETSRYKNTLAQLAQAFDDGEYFDSHMVVDDLAAYNADVASENNRHNQATVALYNELQAVLSVKC